MLKAPIDSVGFPFLLSIQSGLLHASQVSGRCVYIYFFKQGLKRGFFLSYVESVQRSPSEGGSLRTLCLLVPQSLDMSVKHMVQDGFPHVTFKSKRPGKVCPFPDHLFIWPQVTAKEPGPYCFCLIGERVGVSGKKSD
jgi:hypothetical protein